MGGSRYPVDWSRCTQADPDTKVIKKGNLFSSFFFHWFYNNNVNVMDNFIDFFNLLELQS